MTAFFPAANRHYDVRKNIKMNHNYEFHPSIPSVCLQNNKIINVVASIYSNENGLENCILLNKNKMDVEFINSNIFASPAASIYILRTIYAPVYPLLMSNIQVPGPEALLPPAQR